MAMSAVIGSLRVDLSANAAAFVNGLKSAEEHLKRAGERMQAVGRSMTVGVTAPIAAFGALTLKASGDFEAAMNRVAAVSGASADELQALRATAQEMGATTQFSASEAADAMGFLAMAGFSANQTMEALPGTLQLAAAAGMDLASSADIVSNVLSGYGMKVDQLGRVNDVLVKAFTSSNTNLQQLGEAMKYAGPVASAAGVSFEEAAAALGLMGNAGIQASMAGTSLRGAISRILAPTKAMSDAMAEAGLKFTDAAGRILPLDQIVQQLEPHAEDAGLFMTLFGQRAGPALAAMVSQGSAALQDLTKKLLESGGTAQRIGEVQMQGLNGALQTLRSAFEGVQIAIGESGLLDLAEDLVRKVADILSSISEASPEVLRFGTIFAGLAAAIGPALIALGFAATAIAAIGLPVTAVIAGVLGLSAALAGLATYLFSGADEASKLGQASDEVTKALGDEIRQTQILKQELGQSTSMSVAAARQKLQEAVARNENVKAIIAEQRALALGSDRYAALTSEIRDAQNQVNATGFPTIDAATRQNADAFEAAQQRLASLLIERQKLLESDEEVSQQLRDTEANIDKLTAALAAAEGGVVNFGEAVAAPIEPGERLDEVIGKIGSSAKKAGGETEEAVDSIRSSYEGLISSLDPVTGATLRYAEAQETINAALKAGIITSEEAARASELARQRREEEMRGTAEAVSGIGDEITGPFKDALRDGEFSFKSFGDALLAAGNRLRDRLLDQAFKPIEAAIENLFSGGSGSGNGLFSSLGNVLSGAISGAGSGGFTTGQALPGGGALLPAPAMPRFYAKGTNFHPGGMAIVGEEGPELLDLPRGSRVIPNDKLSGGGGGGGSLGTLRVALDAGLIAEMRRASADDAGRIAVEITDNALSGPKLQRALNEAIDRGR